MQTRQKEVKNKRVTVRSSLPLLFLRALTIALIVFCGYKILTSSKWYYPQGMFESAKNQNLAIVGTYITSKNKVLEVMKRVQIPKRPLYMIDVKAFEDRISEIETVKNVYIRRYWFPARMLIVIEDKMPILMIAPDEKSPPAAFFVEDGTYLSADLFPRDEKIYPLKVLTKGDNPSDNFIYWKEDRLKQLLELCEVAEQYSGEKVEYIDVRDPQDVYIKIKPVLLRIGKLDDNTITKLKSISIILPNLDKIEEKIIYVDLRWNVAKYLKIERKEEKNEGVIDSVEHEIG